MSYGKIVDFEIEYYEGQDPVPPEYKIIIEPEGYIEENYNISFWWIETEEYILKQWALIDHNINPRVWRLKRMLTETDYKAIKHSEGELTDEEYQHTLELRRAWRAEINEIESQINNEESNTNG